MKMPGRIKLGITVLVNAWGVFPGELLTPRFALSIGDLTRHAITSGLSSTLKVGRTVRIIFNETSTDHVGSFVIRAAKQRGDDSVIEDCKITKPRLARCAINKLRIRIPVVLDKIIVEAAKFELSDSLLELGLAVKSGR